MLNMLNLQVFFKYSALVKKNAILIFYNTHAFFRIDKRSTPNNYITKNQTQFKELHFTIILHIVTDMFFLNISSTFFFCVIF